MESSVELDWTGRIGNRGSEERKTGKGWISFSIHHRCSLMDLPPLRWVGMGVWMEASRIFGYWLGGFVQCYVVASTGCCAFLSHVLESKHAGRQAGRQAFIMDFWLNDSIDRLSGRARPGHHISWIRFSWVTVPSERRRLLVNLKCYYYHYYYYFDKVSVGESTRWRLGKTYDVTTR